MGYALKPLRRPETLTEMVYKHLTEAIFSREIKPGTKLYEDEIAREMQVSKTPVREALQLLVRAGLVTNEPHSTPCVTEFTRQDVIEIYDLRESLEQLAVRLAAERLTNDHFEILESTIEQAKKCISQSNIETYTDCNERFHGLLLELAGSRRLSAMMNLLHNQMQILMSTSARFLGKPHQSIKEHEEMLSALRDGRTERAVEIMGFHIRSAKSDILRRVQPES